MLFSNELRRIAEASKTSASRGAAAEARGCRRPTRAGDSALPHLPGPKPKLHKKVKGGGPNMFLSKEPGAL